MKIELKNIKHAAFASQETECYQATIYIDGKKSGFVDNGGHGGCDNITWDSKEIREAVSKWEKEQPKEKSAFGDFEYDFNIEFVFHDILQNWLCEKELKRNLKKGLIVRDSKTKNGEWRIFQNHLSQTAPHLMLPMLVKQGKIEKDAICLNLLPLSEAVKLWRNS